MTITMRTIIAALVVLNASVLAQQPKQFNFVTPTTTGRVLVPPAPNWVPSQLSLYDDGTRPVVAFKDKTTDMVLSIILFPNDTGKPTAASCRDAAIDPILQNISHTATVKNQKRDVRVNSDGTTMATASYLIAAMSDMPVRQQNAFGFYGDAHTCAEVHVSKANFKPEDQKLLDDQLGRFIFDANYVPTSLDFGTIASIFYNGLKDYPSAAVYYQRALDTVPTPEPMPGYRRLITDQLSMSYGLSGDLKHSRAVNEAAILRDPDYPLYYYNLACADAEQGNAADAQAHLRQAFERKSNTLPGEHLPDPATDDSILKLKKNKEFWAFVQTLK